MWQHTSLSELLLYKNEARTLPFFKRNIQEISGQLKHPISLTPIDAHLKSLCSKFQFDVILCWQDMRDNMNYTSPLNTVL